MNLNINGWLNYSFRKLRFELRTFLSTLTVESIIYDIYLHVSHFGEHAVLYSSQYLLSLVIWFAIVNSILYITLSIIWRSLYKLVSILRSTYTSYICMFSFLYLRAMNKWNVERAWNWYVRNRRMYFTNNDIITDGFKSYTICHMEWKLSWVTLFDGNGGHARSVF